MRAISSPMCKSMLMVVGTRLCSSRRFLPQISYGIPSPPKNGRKPSPSMPNTVANWKRGLTVWLLLVVYLPRPQTIQNSQISLNKQSTLPRNLRLIDIFLFAEPKTTYYLQGARLKYTLLLLLASRGSKSPVDYFLCFVFR